MSTRKAAPNGRRCVGLRADVWSLVRAAALMDYPHEKPDVSRQCRVLIREALDGRTRKHSRPPAPLELAAPEASDWQTVNLRQEVWDLVLKSAKEDAPFEDPNVAKQTRILILEALGARKGK